MNWHIGQRIVAVKDHSQGKFKKGDEFTIIELRQSPCKCKNVQIDVGIKSVVYYGTCTICKTDYINVYAWWFHEILFAPLDEISDYTADELIEELTTKLPEYETMDNLPHR